MELIYIQLDSEAITQRLQARPKSDLDIDNDNLPEDSETPENFEELEEPRDFEDSEDSEELEASNFLLDSEIPLPYILYQNDEDAESDELDWNSIVDGIMYVALYEPKHEHSAYYKDFLLLLEPELPYILRERLREQYDQQLWQHARDTAHILIFLLPDAAWPLLELCYLYEQEAESAIVRHQFQSCSEAWNLAELTYRQLLERDDMNAKSYYQLGYYYLQCWNFPAAHRAFISSQQLALSPENPLWGQCHKWLQKMRLLEEDTPKDKEFLRSLSRVQDLLLRTFLKQGASTEAPEQEMGNGAHNEAQTDRADISEESEHDKWLSLQGQLNELLHEYPDRGFLWFMHGLSLLYGNDLLTLRDLAEEQNEAQSEAQNETQNEAQKADGPELGSNIGINLGTGRSASQSFVRARNLGWESPLDWQLPYYEAVCYYLEGNYSEAEHKFLEVLRDRPEHAATLYWMEKLYSDLENERSYKYAKVLQEWHPDFPDLLQDFL